MLSMRRSLRARAGIVRCVRQRLFGHQMIAECQYLLRVWKYILYSLKLRFDFIPIQVRFLYFSEEDEVIRRIIFYFLFFKEHYTSLISLYFVSRLLKMYFISYNIKPSCNMLLPIPRKIGVSTYLENEKLYKDDIRGTFNRHLLYTTK